MLLDRQNIDRELSHYLTQVNSICLPQPGDNVISFIYAIKRRPLCSGPYAKVSLFEAANRILSDIVILVGVRQLLTNPHVGNVRLPFDEYLVRLGTEGGNDLTAAAGDCRLLGEAFNVAPSFFQAKKSAMIKKLKSQEADFRLLLFNADAVKDPHYYLEKSEPSMLYLPVGMQSDQQSR